MRELVANGKNSQAIGLLAGHSEIPALSLAEHLVDAGEDTCLQSNPRAESRRPSWYC